MNQISVKIIGIKDESRKDSYLLYLNHADWLKGILSRDFDEWSNFDKWESFSAQQWIFVGLWRFAEVWKWILSAIVVNLMFLFQMILRILKKKCFGKKSAYMIEKVLDEIELAKARRETDGTYSA